MDTEETVNFNLVYKQLESTVQVEGSMISEETIREEKCISKGSISLEKIASLESRYAELKTSLQDDLIALGEISEFQLSEGWKNYSRIVANDEDVKTRELIS